MLWVATLGTGNVGRTLAVKLVEKGHQLMLGTRDPAQKEKSAPQVDNRVCFCSGV